jgi:isoleucyl-tRNA synthetase
MTLYTVLERMARLIAPFTPFIAEQMYRNLVCSVDKSAPESVHLCDYPSPVCETGEELERNMDTVLSIVTLGRSCRNAASMKIRQPLKKMYIQSAPLEPLFADIITSELNVKQAEFVSDASGLIKYQIKPQLRTLGPRYGKLLKEISAALAALGSDFVQKMNRGETHVLTVAGTEVSLTAEDVLIEPMKDSSLVSETERGLCVVLDTELTPELIEEGFVREIVSKVQTMRKEAGFEVMDHITLTYSGSDRIAGIFGQYANEIAGEVLADGVYAKEPAGYVKSWNINGEEAAFGVEKV